MCATRWGPLRSTWCMMFEHMNQVIKHSALRNNFRSTLMTAATRTSQKIAFDLFSKVHHDFNQPVIQVSLTEVCFPGSSPTVDFLISQGLVLLGASQSVEVRWLTKARIASSAFTPGDIVYASLISDGSKRYVALLMDLLAFNDKVFAQMVFIADAPKGNENPRAVTWADLKGASCAPLQQCTFAEVKNVSLTLLHPTARPDAPNDVHFVSW